MRRQRVVGTASGVDGVESRAGSHGDKLTAVALEHSLRGHPPHFMQRFGADDDVNDQVDRYTCGLEAEEYGVR
jgi:hypothetical protein